MIQGLVGSRHPPPVDARVQGIRCYVQSRLPSGDATSIYVFEAGAGRGMCMFRAEDGEKHILDAFNPDSHSVLSIPLTQSTLNLRPYTLNPTPKP